MVPNIGEYVNYSNQGICQVEGVRLLDFGARHPKRDYYILRPVYQKDSHIYVPVDNKTLLEQMKPILSKEEIDQIISSAKETSLPWIKDRKRRTEKARSILSRRNERELLQLVSCLYLKSKEEVKGLSYTDSNILKKAETIIAEEFAFSLNIEAKDVGAYIQQRLLDKKQEKEKE